MNQKITIFCALALSIAFHLTLAPFSRAEAGKKVRIGLSMDTLKEERWKKDRDIFVARAKELGADVLVQAANSDDNLQLSQAENLLTQNIDVLVVVPHNGVVAKTIVEEAHKVGKKVIAYDRLIEDSDVDLYLSFDNKEVGRMQGQYALDHAPKGNYMLLGGAPTDHNAKLYREGQLAAIKPAVDRGDVKVVADPWAKDWLPSEAMQDTENVLTRNNNNIQAVISSNDGEAGGVVSALKAQNLAGKVLVTGQDADLAACQRVVEGTQSMTVYKPIKALASKAAEVAYQVALGNFPKTDRTVNNGKVDVPSILMKPIAVDKDNMESTVIADKYHSQSEVYRNVAGRK